MRRSVTQNAALTNQRVSFYVHTERTTCSYPQGRRKEFWAPGKKIF